MDTTIRTFIAIKLDKEIQEALRQVQEEIKRLEVDVKWVRPENIHLTLKFLGNLPPKKFKAVTETFPSLLNDSHSFEAEITHLGVFPTLKRPRVIWAGIRKNADRLTSLADLIEEGMSRLGFPKGKKGFSPHITIGRLRSAKNLPQLSEMITEYPFPSGLIQPIRNVILFKSTLTSQGPIYEAIHTLQLS